MAETASTATTWVGPEVTWLEEENIPATDAPEEPSALLGVPAEAVLAAELEAADACEVAWEAEEERAELAVEVAAELAEPDGLPEPGPAECDDDGEAAELPVEEAPTLEDADIRLELSDAPPLEDDVPVPAFEVQPTGSDRASRVGTTTAQRRTHVVMQDSTC